MLSAYRRMHAATITGFVLTTQTTMPGVKRSIFLCTRAEGESVGEGDEDNRLMSGSAGEEWGAGAKDRQQTTFSQPEQSYEAAFNKVRPWRQ